MSTLRSSIAVALLGVVSLAACASSDKVGDDDLLAFDQEQVQQLGGSTTTTVASDVGSMGGDASPGTTAAAATTLPPEQQQVTVEVIIQDDEQGAPFTPNVVRVPLGGKVRFLNKGTKTYSIIAQDGSFGSPPIGPGEAWIYEANVAGSFNYSDDVRTYSQGTIQVVG